MNDPYRSIVQISRDYITLIDRNHRYEFVNKAYLAALGRSADEIVGATVADVWGRERFEAAIEMPLKRCLEGEEVLFIDEFPFGENMRYVEVRFFPYRDEKDGPVTHALVISHDISRLGELETRLMAYEFRDPATGLFNRRSLDIILEREIQKSELEDTPKPRILFVLAIDNLAEIRRQHGSEVSNHIMENTGIRVHQLLGNDNPVFRSESDELSVLVTTITDPEDVAPVADRLLDAVSMPYPKGLFEIRPEYRLGIAVYPKDAPDAGILIQRAEAALSSARERHVSYQVYDSDLHARSVEKLRLTAQLRKSLFEDRFELYYQPIVDTAGAIRGAECLLRWRHPEFGLLLPGKFIGLAEETGLIQEMEKRVIFTACRQLARWKQYGIYLSVNLSVRLFEDEGLIELLETALKQAGGIRPEKLKLEITESEALSNTHVATRRIQELSERGFGVYIDDFGTGQSSLRYLKDLEAAVLKVDRAFVVGMEVSDEDRNFLESIINLIHTRRRYTIIEGVEKASQAKILKSLEADALQGFYFSKPIPAEDFEVLLASGETLPRSK